MRTRTWLPLVVALAAVLPGCGSDEAAAPDAVSCRSIRGTTFTIEATNMAFVDRCLVVEPGTYEVTFDNGDEGTGHNLRITGPGVDVRSRLFVGPGTDTFAVDLTTPGTYRYTCDPHAVMVGTIEVVDPAAPETSEAPS